MAKNMLSGDLMTLSEMADYLKVAEKTVLRMIQKKEIPCVKIASQWRFDRGLIDQWILSRMNSAETDELTRLILDDPDTVPLSRLIPEKYILTGLDATDREEILHSLVTPLFKEGLVHDIDEYTERLLERENMMPTTLGRGIAMPHIRNPRENLSGTPAIVMGICPGGIAFAPGSSELTYVFFLIYTNSEIAHLRIIGKLNAFLRNFVKFNEFLTAQSPKDISRVLLKYQKTDINLSVNEQKVVR